jgi:GTPase
VQADLIESRFGRVAIVGRPNVGKSTLLNRLLGQKLSITAGKPQTTRHAILGIVTEGPNQIALIDTPGLHRAQFARINKRMNQQAIGALEEADHIVMVIEALKFTDEDAYVLERLKSARCPVSLVVNKVDLAQPREALLPYLTSIRERREFAHIWLVAARTGSGVATLKRELAQALPRGLPVYAEDEITDRNARFLAAEFVREQLVRMLGQELPYATTVEIERYVDETDLTRIHAVIWVEREGQKAIVVGEAGAMLKRIGTQARLNLEKLLGTKVFLELWVKVKASWSNDERALERFGY